MYFICILHIKIYVNKNKSGMLMSDEKLMDVLKLKRFLLLERDECILYIKIYVNMCFKRKYYIFWNSHFFILSPLSPLSPSLPPFLPFSFPFIYFIEMSLGKMHTFLTPKGTSKDIFLLRTFLRRLFPFVGYV